MKQFISMIILLIFVVSFSIWDGLHIDKTFTHLQIESAEICKILENEDIYDEQLKNKVTDIEKYWTKEMDTLCISISRKDLQPISDFIQYLISAIDNESIEDAITYSNLLKYNIEGLAESNKIGLMNLL
ncbi:MAG: DUF4363 family protein [Candidatus Onthoplasma sp.]